MYILLQQRQRSLADITTRLTTQQQHIQSKRNKLLVLLGKLRELDPTRVLERGYSMTVSSDGQLITQVADLAPGDSMQVRFRDGTAQTTVESVTSQ